ncbi:hypothetical protein [Flavobacterium sp. FlaQc-50]|uniref:hypothetical protein n=1 Tax=unclassified Flavobacterium TaxID=196869 RepID=UPI003756BB17
METKYKISIPEPCTENWDKMTPKDNGRFCLSCTKTVVDFTTMLPEEVQHYFISNQNKSICGRFKNTQLDEIIIQIPNRVLYSQTQYHKMFLLALFIAMGTTLFSCSDRNGNKKKIDKVEVTKNESMQEHNTLGMPARPAKDSLEYELPPPPPPKVHYQKFIKPIVRQADIKPNGNSEMTEIIQEEDTAIYSGMVALETRPEYPGGMENFHQFLLSELNLPTEAEPQKTGIKISFTIEKDGSLSSFEFPKNTNPKITEEITRVLKLSPKWKPAESNGKKIRFKYGFPLQF